MRKLRKSKNNLKAQCAKGMKNMCILIVNILQWIFALLMAVFFVLAPFLALAIMYNNVNSGITHPDIDVQTDSYRDDDSIGGYYEMN